MLETKKKTRSVVQDLTRAGHCVQVQRPGLAQVPNVATVVSADCPA
jgi:hypothetical protein